MTSPLLQIGSLPPVTSCHLLGVPPPSPFRVTSFMDGPLHRFLWVSWWNNKVCRTHLHAPRHEVWNCDFNYTAPQLLLDRYLPFFWLNSTHKLPWVSLANLVESWVTSITQLWSWLMASSETHNGLTRSRTKTNYVAAVVAHTYRHGTILELLRKIDS